MLPTIPLFAARLRDTLIRARLFGGTRLHIMHRNMIPDRALALVALE